MTDTQLVKLREGLQAITEESAKMAGFMQQAYQSATNIVEIATELGAMIDNQVCQHPANMRTGYWKSPNPGMVKFWCKGCQAEQEIPDPSDTED